MPLTRWIFCDGSLVGRVAEHTVRNMDAIGVGREIEVRDAFGRTYRKRALSAVEDAGRFPVVWACSEEEWESAQQEGREPEPELFPWPLASIEASAHA